MQRGVSVSDGWEAIAKESNGMGLFRVSSQPKECTRAWLQLKRIATKPVISPRDAAMTPAAPAPVALAFPRPIPPQGSDGAEAEAPLPGGQKMGTWMIVDARIFPFRVMSSDTWIGNDCA